MSDREPTIKLEHHSGSLLGWWAHVSIPHPTNPLIAYEWCHNAFTRDRVVRKAERAIRQHYADAALAETLTVPVEVVR